MLSSKKVFVIGQVCAVLLMASSIAVASDRAGHRQCESPSDRPCRIQLEQRGSDVRPHPYIYVPGQDVPIAWAYDLDIAIETVSKLRAAGYCSGNGPVSDRVRESGSGRNEDHSFHSPRDSSQSYETANADSDRMKTWTCSFTQYAGTGVSESAARTALYSSCLVQNMPTQSCMGYSNAATCRAE
jgi:hypothetical protein